MRLDNRTIVAIFFAALTGCSDSGGNPDSGTIEVSSSSGTVDPIRPNILFIAIDDLNDWIEPLGGHPQAKTPNLARFAKEAVTFERNYTAAPACNPSRFALLTGAHTYTTGVYSNLQDWREIMPDAISLPKYLNDHGYWSAGAGKIFHNNQPAPDAWDDYYPSKEKHMPDYFYPSPGKTVNMPFVEGLYTAFDWSGLDLSMEETGDHKSASWVMDQLGREHEKPFFLALGVYRPHLPWYVPQKYFDMFPLEDIQLPEIVENDLEDVPERGVALAMRGNRYHRPIVENGLWKNAVRGYLASTTYADDVVGEVLQALENSPYADNTIVVLWSDHGWHLGEKTHWRKYSLWENAARSVLMIKAPKKASASLPEGSAPGGISGRTTSLIDIFPTLIELTGVPEKGGMDGRSLVPLLRDPNAAWGRHAITTHDHMEFSVRSEDFRYIRYIDGGEELYDHRVDPHEWNNLAADDSYAAVIEDLGSVIPENPAPLIDNSYD